MSDSPSHESDDAAPVPPVADQTDPTGLQQPSQYQPYPQPGYMPVLPPDAPAMTQPQNGMGLAALVLGIVGLVTGWIPFVACFGWIACVLAIVFGAIGFSKANGGKATNKNAAIAGLSLGIAGLLIGLILSVAFWGSLVPTEAGDSGSTDVAADPAREEDAADEAAEPEPEAEAEAPQGIGEGTWEVGTEIEPGTYVTTAAGSGVFDGCYAARLSGFSGEFDDIITNLNIDGGARGRLTIAEGDLGVEFSGDCLWALADEGNVAAVGAEIGNGIWEVGTEVEPGTYVTQAEGEGILDSCYVARLSGFSAGFEDIIANENVDGGAQGRITIEDSDTGVEFSGACVWTLE